MKNVIVLDDDELVIKETLLSELLYRSYLLAQAGINQDERRDMAFHTLGSYRRIEEEVSQVYKLQGMTSNEYIQSLKRQIDNKFPIEDDFKETIDSEALPF